MIADMLTIEENFPTGIEGPEARRSWAMPENNVANSLMVVCAKLGMHFAACGPKELHAQERAGGDVPGHRRRRPAASVTLTEDVKEACTDADVIYTDIWVSMGEPDERVGRAHPVC